MSSAEFLHRHADAGLDSDGVLGLTSEQAFHYLFLIVCESALIGFLMKTSACISEFQARKMCHAGTGIMLLQLDSREAQARWFVYIFGICSLGVTWELIPRIPVFRWGRTKDIGMTAYCSVAMFWFYCQMPVYVLAPMFFADPAGAVIGKYLSNLKSKGYDFSNPIWWQRGGVTKTLGGSAAVLFFTVISFPGPASLPVRILIGVIAVIAEALGGAYDNLLLVVAVVGSRCILNYVEFGSPSLSVVGSWVW